MVSRKIIAEALAIAYETDQEKFSDGEDFYLSMMKGQKQVPCSLCGLPSGFTEEGANWYLCVLCEGTDEAWKAGYCHDKE